MNFEKRERHRRPEQGRGPTDWLFNVVLVILIGLARTIPYRPRIAVSGALLQFLLGWLGGYRRRSLANLAYAMPELPPRDMQRVARGAANNAGRVLIEYYSGAAFRKRACAQPIAGAGLDELRRATQNGRGALLISGHFGNYEAIRAALNAEGIPVGFFYRPLNNYYANQHYEAALRDMGEPVFGRRKEGFGALVDHVRQGGVALVLNDQYFYEGAELSFFGQTATTALTAAKVAIANDIPLFPAYAARLENGLDFSVTIEPALAPTTAPEMTQCANDSLEARVRSHPEQWIWFHRRWKPHRDARRAAANMGP